MSSVGGRRVERVGRRRAGDPRGRHAPRWWKQRRAPVYECSGCGRVFGGGEPAHGSLDALDRCLLAVLGYDWRRGSRVAADEVPAALARSVIP